MQRQHMTYGILGVTLIVIIIGVSITNRWVDKQMKDAEMQSIAARQTESTPKVINPSNPSLDLIGTPYDPLAPVKKKATIPPIKKLPPPERNTYTDPRPAGVLVQ